jgi:ABC-2 type transport system permease protein
MNLQAIYTIWLRELKRFSRSKSRIIGSMTQAIFFLGILGVGMNNLIDIPEVSYLTFIAPGIIGMTILFPSIIAGVSVLWDKQFGFLKEILVAPVSRLSIMVGKALGGATTTMFQGLVMLFAIFAIGIMPFSWYGFGFALIIMVVSAIALVSLGLAVASRMDDPHGFQMIMNFLIMPMFMLSGAFFPIDNLPGPLMFFVSIDPLTYTVDALRNVLLGVSTYSLAFSLGVLSAFCAAMLLLGAFFFRKIK